MAASAALEYRIHFTESTDMSRRARICGALVLVFALGACTEQDNESVPTQTAVVADVTARSGEEIYQSVCATCHEAGVPKAPSRNMLGFMSPGAIHRALTEGIMQAQAASLSDEEMFQLIEFLTGRRPGPELAAEMPMCEGEAAVFDVTRPPRLAGWGFTPDNRRTIPTEVAGIDRHNVESLKLKWAFGFPDAVRARSHPAVAAGAVFVGSQSGAVYALDQQTGCVRWQFHADAEVRTGMVLQSWQATDSAADPLLFFGDFLGNVYALKAFNGEQVWKQRPDEHQNATITAAPTLFEDRLYVSVSSLEVVSAIDPDYACCQFRGSVVAYEASTGALQWKTHTIASTPSPQYKNAVGVMQVGPSGAPVWNTPAIDIKRRQLYFGTGENYSSPPSLTSDAIFAVGLDEGEIRWTFQATPNDAWNGSCSIEPRVNCPREDGPDFDFGGDAVLATDGDGRDYVVAGQKSGIVWALDPDSGELIWKNKVGRGGIIGGIHFGIAVHDETVVVPIADAIADASYVDNYQGTPRPGVYALDLRTGDFRWQWPAVDACQGKAELCMKGNSAVPTLTPELALMGSLDGHLRIHDIDSGEVLWDFDTAQDFPSVSGVPAYGGALEGGTAPLLDNGMMFLNSGYLFNQHMPGNVLLAFEVAR